MQSEVNKNIARKLKGFRIAKSISQAEMDARAALPRSATCKIETEAREATAAELIRMARVVGVPLGAFASDTSVAFSEEVKLIEALRVIPFEDYQRILGMLETSVYYSAKDAPETQQTEMQGLVEVINQLRTTDSRPRTHLAHVKRVRK